jgi:hypothetical protein
MWLYNVKMLSASPKWFYTDIVEVSNNWQLSRRDIIDLHFCGFGECRSVRIKRQVRLTQYISSVKYWLLGGGNTLGDL